MIQGLLCKIYDAHYLKIGCDEPVCTRLCLHYASGYPPCGEKPECKLFDKNKVIEMELK